jgi:hypothetical protein
MKFQRTTADRALVAGVFQNPDSASIALRELRRQGFWRSVALSGSDSGSDTQGGLHLPAVRVSD